MWGVGTFDCARNFTRQPHDGSGIPGIDRLTIDPDKMLPALQRNYRRAISHDHDNNGCGRITIAFGRPRGLRSLVPAGHNRWHPSRLQSGHRSRSLNADEPKP